MSTQNTPVWLAGGVHAIREWWKRETTVDVDWLSQCRPVEPTAFETKENLTPQQREHLEAQFDKAKGGNWKPTNPKDVMGIRKVSFCCIPFPVLAEVALGMQEGGMKYGRHNYRDKGVATSTYIDAVFRHVTEYWEGEDIDEESGVHHLSKAISTLVVLRDAILNDKCTDDRPIKPTNPRWLKELNVKASALVDKYPQPEKPYTHLPLPERS